MWIILDELAKACENLVSREQLINVANVLAESLSDLQLDEE